MENKITITDVDLEESGDSSLFPTEEKIVFCDLSHKGDSVLQKKIPLVCYFVFMVPVLGVVAVLLGCVQRKYRFLYQMPAGIVSILSTVLPIVFLTSGFLQNGKNWKNVLAEQAQKGVVIIETETQGRLSPDTKFGSGVVVAKTEDDSTLILTNRHVVCNSNGMIANSINVLTASGKEYPAIIAALPKDYDVDMALLCINQKNHLKALGNIGNYSSLKTGDEVVAIGHPEGLSFSMTEGIISALRDRMLIQSSASINPGNSGGPLLDSRGRIIGINTYSLKDAQGLSFAYRADFILKESAWDYKKDISRLLKQITVE